jgi:hypothetical protein
MIDWFLDLCVCLIVVVVARDKIMHGESSSRLIGWTQDLSLL